MPGDVGKIVIMKMKEEGTLLDFKWQGWHLINLILDRNNVQVGLVQYVRLLGEKK